MSLKLNKDILCLLIRLVYCVSNLKKSMNRDIYGCILKNFLNCNEKTNYGYKDKIFLKENLHTKAKPSYLQASLQNYIPENNKKMLLDS